MQTLVKIIDIANNGKTIEYDKNHSRCGPHYKATTVGNAHETVSLYANRDDGENKCLFRSFLLHLCDREVEDKPLLANLLARNAEITMASNQETIGVYVGNCKVKQQPRVSST